MDVVFYKHTNGGEPVKEWLRSLPRADRIAIGTDMKTAEYGWPVGMPLIRKLEPKLWEVRTNLNKRIARVLFTVKDKHMVLLHGFIKKTQTTPGDDLRIARNRMKKL